MRRRRAALVTILLCAGLSVHSTGRPAQSTADAASGLPSGVPPAATRPEPALPKPGAWPFDEAFPRTSGTGRHAGGAYVWTDFLYDDNGAVGLDIPFGESAGAPTFGTYAYPEEDQAGNGADVFRLGIGVDGTETVWRVDWNTLVDPAVPIVAFAIDVDGGGPATPWPANVGVTSAGPDRFVVVSGKAARILDASGAAVDTGTVEVDLNARSFVARFPQRAGRPGGTKAVWAASGLADEDGTAFLSLGPEHRHIPGQPNVYNVAFRDYADEPRSNNFWFDTAQATALATPGADVTAFSSTVDWDALGAKAEEPEPLVRGWSNRWYVSNVEIGQGRTSTTQSTADNEPNYLGRVQPYGVWVPEGYVPGTPSPLTWLLHSFTINHNQYGATMPTLVELACEQRGSLCATTLQRGPDGGYVGVHQLDFWEVWRALASDFTLDADRTLIGGYSMGGFGTFNIALDHPDLFAGMAVFSAAAVEDVPRLENARLTPYYHSHGVLDQLVPYTEEALPTIDELDRLGYRYRFDTYPTQDHVVWSLEDGLYLAAEWMAEADRVRPPDPGRIVYRFFVEDLDPELGIGPTGAWWLRDLTPCDADKQDVRAEARSLAIPEAAVEPERATSDFVDDNGNPVQRAELTWKTGAIPAASPVLQLDLDNVGTASVDLARARLLGDDAVAVVDNDCPTTLTLTGIPNPPRTVLLPAGHHEFVLGQSFRPPPPPAAPRRSSRLPATGEGPPLAAAAALVAAALLLRRGRLALAVVDPALEVGGQTRG